MAIAPGYRETTYRIPVTVAMARHAMRHIMTAAWLQEAIDSLDEAARNPDYHHIAEECRSKVADMRAILETQR